MYKLLLCWRYLRTRYLALVCIISVMLGVATLIVVNSVMSGFSTKLRERLHGLHSDLLVESMDADGMYDPATKMALIQADPFLNPRIDAMTPTLEIFAMLQYRYRDRQDRFREVPICRPVRLIGIDPEGRGRAGGFKEHLIEHENDAAAAFQLTAKGQQEYERQHPPWPALPDLAEAPPAAGEKPPPEPPPSQPHVPEGIVVGHAIAHFRRPDAKPDDKEKDVCTLYPGEDVVITTISGQRLSPVYDRFVVTDYFKSEMSEYDANYVFVPLAHLQKLRTMENRVTAIQVKLKNYDHDKKEVVARLKQLFGNLPVMVQTWEWDPLESTCRHASLSIL